jgi:hypothetical protein
MKRALWCGIAAAMCIGGARAQWIELNPKLKAKVNPTVIRKVVILPAMVSFQKVGAKGSEGELPEAGQLGKDFYAAVSKELVTRGVEVLPNPAAQAKDDAARYAIADLQAKFDDVAVQIRRKRSRVEKGRYTLGDRVSAFEPGAASDTLVFIRGGGSRHTRGRTAIAIATRGIGGLLEQQFVGEITFVDARTGEVLAFAPFDRLKDMTTKSEERFAQSVREALWSLPLPLRPPKH